MSFLTCSTPISVLIHKFQLQNAKMFESRHCMMCQSSTSCHAYIQFLYPLDTTVFLKFSLEIEMEHWAWNGLTSKPVQDRSRHWRCSVKSVFKKFANFKGKHKVFPVKFAQFLRTPILKNLLYKVELIQF